MIEAIRKKLVKSDDEKFNKFVEDYRKTIPERYNQIKLMDYLLDDEVDHYISISNRADGKSFNYIGFLLDFSIKFGIGLTFIVRHYTVRKAGQQLFEKIIDMKEYYNPRDFVFMNTDFYVLLMYKGKKIAIFTDLNQATDLKYQSNFMQDFPIMIYDEFLALEGDYLIDEWDRLATIYSSINRKEEIPYIKAPKVLYLGNAVNFSSPVLANLNLFNILEKHPMNTVGKYGYICIEFNRNENANEQRNLRAFQEQNNPLTHGEFYINKHNIATGNDRNRINTNPDYIIIKLRDNFLKITYNRDTFEMILSIIAYSESYDYNMFLKDNNEKSVFLNETFYDPDHAKKYVKDIFLFDNMYSKDTITDTLGGLVELKLHKVVKHHVSSNQSRNNNEYKEQVYKENYLQNTKKKLFQRFFE